MTVEMFLFLIALIIVAFFTIRIRKPQPFILAYFKLMERIEYASTETELWHLDMEISDFRDQYFEKDKFKIRELVKDMQATAKDRLKELRTIEKPKIDTLKPQKVI